MVKDVCYGALFDKKDLPYVYRLAEEVRATHNQDLVNSFNNNLERKWNDHNPLLDGVEILQVSKADDLVVTSGVNQCIDQILGTSITRWQFMAKGLSGTTPTAGQTLLSNESVASPRKDMSTSGWREWASTSLRFAGIFGESAPTETILECGVFTTQGNNTGIMLNRNSFSNFGLTHNINIDGIVLSCVVEFVPVM